MKNFEKFSLDSKKSNCLVGGRPRRRRHERNNQYGIDDFIDEYGDEIVEYTTIVIDELTRIFSPPKEEDADLQWIELEFRQAMA